MVALQLWWDTIRGVVTTAPREHVDVPSATPSSASGPHPRAALCRSRRPRDHVREGARRAGDHFEFSAPDFEIVREAACSYGGRAAYRNARYELSGVAEPERLIGTRVSPELFDVLGVAPMLGRSLTADDDRQNLRVVMLTYGLWSRAFGRDSSRSGAASCSTATPTSSSA